MSGKVVLITGAARGQGRAHAARLSAEGADTILVDIAGPLPPSVPYDSATPEDLAHTAELVIANGRRAVTATVDTRDHDALCAAVDQGVAELGRLDVIVANAGICCPAPWDRVSPNDFQDTVNINLVGTWNTVMAGAKHIIAGRTGRIDHPDRLRGWSESGAFHGGVHGKQARRDRARPLICRGTRPLRHPGEQPSSRIGRDTDG